MAEVRRDLGVLARLWLTLLCVVVVLGGTWAHSALTPQGPAAPEPPQGKRSVNLFAAPGEPGTTAAAAAAAGQEMVEAVRIEGNESQPLDKVIRFIHTRPNRPLEQETIDEDVRRLNNSRMFVEVKASTQKGDNGTIVIFTVKERAVFRYVRFVGCKGIKRNVLAKETGLKTGEPMDPYLVTEARRKIVEYYQSKGYTQIYVDVFEGDKPGDRGAVFIINEGAKEKIAWTGFVGNDFASSGQLKTHIKQKPGFLWIFRGEVDRKEIDEDINRLTDYYRSMGFYKASVGKELHYNEAHSWLSLTYVIDEGPRYQVRNVSVVGAKKFSDKDLLTDTKLRPGMPFNRNDMQSDVNRMKDIYGGEGYIFTEIEADQQFQTEPGTIDLVYVIKESQRYKVGKIEPHIKGDNPHTKESTVRNRISQAPGQWVDTREMRASEARLKRSQLFAVDPSRGAMPTLRVSKQEAEKLREKEEPEVADKPQRSSGFRGQSPDPQPQDEATAEPLPQRQSEGQLGEPRQPGQPGEPGQPGSWAPPTPRYEPAPSDAPSSESQTPGPVDADGASSQAIDPATVDPAQELDGRTSTDGLVIRGQNPGESSGGRPLRWVSADDTSGAAAETETTPPMNVRRDQQVRPVQYESNAGAGSDWQSGATSPAAAGSPSSPAASRGAGAYAPLTTSQGGQDRESYEKGLGTYTGDAGTTIPQVDTTPRGLRQPAAGVASDPAGWPADAGATRARRNAVADAPAPGSPDDPLSRGGYTPFLGLNPNEPGGYTDPQVPLEALLEETTTGRLMFSVGVNSDAGLVASAILDEQNFDFLRPPTGWDDIVSGRAWRGAGQQFRMEAMPGTQMQRYTVSFTEPYLFDTYQSSISGYYFDRRYVDWMESRGGGRTSIGCQLVPDLWATLAYTGENVVVSNPRVNPALVPALAEVMGANTRHGFRAQLAHDTRDNTFLATEGYLMQFGFEQVIGDFNYPRGDLDIRKYFLLRQHADGTQRHVLSLMARMAVSANNTPIYDRYYLGGFSSLRGWAFRGAAPTDPATGVKLGGDFMLATSLEYLIPITADDTLRAVVFCDNGVVQPTIRDWTERYRASVGFGMRITIPAMGPAPIALDFAFPISKEAGDQQQIFSFFVGFFR